VFGIPSLLFYAWPLSSPGFLAMPAIFAASRVSLLREIFYLQPLFSVIMFVETFRFASEEIPLCSEEFILLDLYLLEVFRFASEKIIRFLARNSACYIHVC